MLKDSDHNALELKQAKRRIAILEKELERERQLQEYYHKDIVLISSKGERPIPKSLNDVTRYYYDFLVGEIQIVFGFPLIKLGMLSHFGLLLMTLYLKGIDLHGFQFFVIFYPIGLGLAVIFSVITAKNEKQKSIQSLSDKNQETTKETLQ